MTAGEHQKSKPFDALVQVFGLLYERLPGAYNSIVGLLGYRAPQLVTQALAPLLDTDAPKILDVGCGTGLTGKAMRTLRHDAVMDGFDMSEQMLAEARKTGIYNTLHIGDATKPLPVEGERYDAAMASGLYTLGHVGPEALMPVLHAIKPGGLFALNIYDAAWEKLHFRPALDQLIASGTITVRVHEQATHFGHVGQTCQVLVLEKARVAA